MCKEEAVVKLKQENQETSVRVWLDMCMSVCMYDPSLTPNGIININW